MANLECKWMVKKETRATAGSPPVSPGGAKVGFLAVLLKSFDRPR